MDENFNHTMVYINGAFEAKVDKDTNYYKAIGLSPASIHTISTHTVDIWGNINQTWVNDTATTIEAPDVWISPIELNATLHQGEFENMVMKLGNDGAGLLEFNISDTVDSLFFSDDMESGVDGRTSGGSYYGWAVSGAGTTDWLTEFPTSGTVDAGNQTNITVTIDATSLDVGQYSAVIIINNNDPDENPVDVPLNLTVIPPDHDIEVANISAPGTVEINSTIFVNSTISNNGLNNESDVTVNFLVDEVTQSNTTIQFIESEKSTNASFRWTVPDTTRIYNITIYAEPVHRENITRNNILSLTIHILRFPVHNLDTGKKFTTIQAAIDDSNTGDGHIITVDPGIYNENVIVHKQLTIRSTSGDPEDTVANASNPDGHVFDVIAYHVNISGFTVNGATGYYAAGICLNWMDYCNIFNNSVSNNNYGIYMEGSNNTIVNNNISDNENGIRLMWASNNNIESNNISNNCYDGIFLSDSSINIVRNNGISNNHYGIYLEESSNNNIYLNNFIDNPASVYSYRSINKWNSAETIDYIYNGKIYTNCMGNYWDDYTGPDGDNDGIGNTSYSIDADKDNYPLMEPFENYIIHPTEDDCMKGDLDHNGKITPADAVIALQLAVSGEWDANADVSGDGQITSLDALMILQAAAGSCNL